MPAGLSEYEKRRLKNLEDNRKILSQIGLTKDFLLPFKVIKKPAVFKRKSDAKEWQPEKKAKQQIKDEDYGSIRSGPARRSSRLQGKAALDVSDIQEQVEYDLAHDDSPRIRVPKFRENFYGPVDGVDVGTYWLMRMEACAAGVHRPTVAGIHGGHGGAYSIALSGGYADDVDMGDYFTYTGEGGRDLKGTPNKPKNLRTAPQSKDQTLTRGNLALSRNVETGNPVRVIRGYKLRSPFAPESGYRYDGLYSVEKAWFTTGVEGFGVWKFAMKRLTNQAPPPWECKPKEEMDDICSSQDSGLGSEGEHSSDTPSSELGSEIDALSKPPSELGESPPLSPGNEQAPSGDQEEMVTEQLEEGNECVASEKSDNGDADMSADN